MTMKNGAKFEEELTFRFKIGMRNLTNCDQALESLKNVHFNPPFRYTSQITSVSRECFLRHYGGQLKTAIEKEAGEKIDCKR